MSYELIATHPDAAAEAATCEYGSYLLGAIAYQDKLYFGYGNWHKSSCQAPKAVRAFSPVTGLFEPEPEFMAQTDSIYDFRVGPDGGLYIPHIDPYSPGAGNYTGIDYSKKVNGVWSDSPSFGMYHVFDVQWLGNRMFLIGGIGQPAGNGCVYEVQEGQITAQQSLLQTSDDGTTTRLHFGFVWNNELYVQADDLSACQIFNGASWRSGPNLLPSGGQGFFSNHFAGKVVYVGRDRGSSGKLYTFNGTSTQSAKSSVIKYCIYGNTLYLSQSTGTILKTTNLANWQTLPTFTNGLATCLVGHSGRLYIGTSQSKVYRSTFEI